MESCPVCRYSLRGLSEPIRCPECGLCFGIDPVLFRVSGKPWLALALASWACAVVLLLLYLRKGPEPERYGLLAPIALASLGSLFQWHRARSRFLIVAAAEVRIFHGNVQTAIIPLDSQTEARWDWATGRIIFQRSGIETGASFTPPSRRLAGAILRSIEGRTRRETAGHDTSAAAR